VGFGVKIKIETKTGDSHGVALTNHGALFSLIAILINKGQLRGPVGLNYTREEQLELCSCDVTPRRLVRKAIFSHELWLLSHEPATSSSAVVGTSAHRHPHT